MTKRYDTAALIIHELEQQGSCTLDALAYRLPTCTWNQVFMAAAHHSSSQPHQTPHHESQNVHTGFVLSIAAGKQC